MSNPSPVLVVGTTTDYIDWIRRTLPGECLFLTEPSLRQMAHEPAPHPDEEVLASLSDPVSTERALIHHLSRHGMELAGVACFDCESLELAAILAQISRLPYPSVEAIRRCRNKYAMKRAWTNHGVPCPPATLASSSSEAAAFAREMGVPCVVKPVSGSGGELVFSCASPKAAEECWLRVSVGLDVRSGHRLYEPLQAGSNMIALEALAQGTEYSCDFFVDGDFMDLVRLTRKVSHPSGLFGATFAYELVPEPSVIPWADGLVDLARRAAAALGISRALCMMDFMVQDEGLSLLELTPRPGGDCLPLLLRTAMGLDILQLTISTARGRYVSPAGRVPSERFVGLRLLANREGTISRISAERLYQDPRVREVELLRRPGNVVRTPPRDYDSWVLGHVIFVPNGQGSITEECIEIAALLAWDTERA